MPSDPPEPPRPVGQLPAEAIGYLNNLAAAIRAAPTNSERAGAIVVAVAAARRYQAEGVSWTRIAVAFGISPATLRRWRTTHDAITQDQKLPAVLPLSVTESYSAILWAHRSLAADVHDLDTRLMLMSASESIMASIPADVLISARTSDSQQQLTLTGRARRIVIVSGDPRPGGNNFGLEVADIRRSLRAAAIDVKEIGCADLGEISNSLADYRPVVLHVAAHSSFGGVVLSIEGQPISVEHGTFIARIIQSPAHPRMAVLNFCASALIAHALTQAVESVISWPGTITDEQACCFAKHLYRELAQGRTTGCSFGVARDTTTEKWPGLMAPIISGATNNTLF